jgi:hypothetical protein
VRASGRELGRALLREGPHGVAVELPRQLLVGQGVAGAAAVDLDAGLEFLARAGGHAQDGGEGVRERRAAALVLDAAHQGGQGEAAGSRAAASVKSSWDTGYDDETTIRLLRAVQRKLAGVARLSR